MKFSAKSIGLVGALAPALVLAVATVASANVTQAGQLGGGVASQLPWEGVLGSLAQALTGTTAKIICIIAIFIAGVALIFGEDLGHFAKRMLMIVIAAAFLIGAGGFVTGIVNGAHI